MLFLGDLADHDHHDTGAAHPERAARLDAVRLGIADAVGTDGVVTVEPRLATAAELARVHDPHYLWSLERLAEEGGGALDPDTPVSPGSWDTALLAAGTGLAVVDALDRRGDGVGFVAVRPPGHHARRAAGMGFCLLNNVAIAAADLVARDRRVLIVDWDVHHGNGTQEIFWDDPRVLYASVHQAPAYPGTGRSDETGGPGAPGTTCNVPLPPHATGELYRRAIDEVLADVAHAFAPDWVLISAGFDAHRDDPLADHLLTAADYAELAERVAALAPTSGRVAVFLEGGYDLGALRRSVQATVGRLTGTDEPEGEAPSHGGPGAEVLGATRSALLRARAGAGTERTGAATHEDPDHG